MCQILLICNMESDYSSLVYPSSRDAGLKKNNQVPNCTITRTFFGGLYAPHCFAPYLTAFPVLFCALNHFDVSFVVPNIKFDASPNRQDNGKTKCLLVRFADIKFTPLSSVNDHYVFFYEFYGSVKHTFSFLCWHSRRAEIFKTSI